MIHWLIVNLFNIFGGFFLFSEQMYVFCQQDIDLDQDLDHYEMKEEEPVDGKKSEDEGIEKENLAILEKIRKNQRQDHLNVRFQSVTFLIKP